MEKIVAWINDFFRVNGWALLGTLAILVLGILVINLILALVKKGLKRQTKIDPIAFPYIRSGIRVILYIVLFISIAVRLGFSSTSLVTILGTAGLAVSLALQNSLSNMVNGVFLMLSKPFARGDLVSIDGVDGTVQSIGLIYTKLMTADRQVLIPNSDVAGAKISDISATDKRRCDITFTVSHSENAARVREAALGAIAASDMPLTEPNPEVVVSGLTLNGMELTARIWVKTEHYLPFRDFIFEQLKNTFDREGIAIPAGRVEVTVLEK